MAIHGADPTKLRLSCTYKPNEIMDKKIPTAKSAFSSHVMALIVIALRQLICFNDRLVHLISTDFHWHIAH